MYFWVVGRGKWVERREKGQKSVKVLKTGVTGVWEFRGVRSALITAAGVMAPSYASNY